ncbi:MAG: DUF3276 family protein [Mangrovibacterium sp.]
MEFNKKESINSSELRAGSRTYFFDVKETRSGEYYLVLTESKKAKNEYDRNERHRLFLYREDLDAFLDHINDAADFILDKQPLQEEERRKFRNTRPEGEKKDEPDFSSDINFEDL